MMTEVAGCGEKRRRAVFVAAVAVNRLQRRERVRDLAAILVGQLNREDAARVVDVRPFAEAGADDHAGDTGLIEHVTAGNDRDRHPVPGGDGCRGGQDTLQRGPAAGAADEARVLHLRPRAGSFPVGFVLPSQRSVSQPPATVP